MNFTIWLFLVLLAKDVWQKMHNTFWGDYAWVAAFLLLLPLSLPFIRRKMAGLKQKTPRRLWPRNWQLKLLKFAGVVWVVVLAYRALVLTDFAWKEEVRLHDGSTIVVARDNVYDRRLGHEIGQHPPLAEHSIRFKIPSTGEAVTWESSNRSFSEPENLSELSLDFLDNVPYLAAAMDGCIAYNRWGRPNPPYVFFKYVGEWRRIPLEEFPEQFKINLVFGITEQDKIKITADSNKYGVLRAETVAKINAQAGRPYQYYTLLRTPQKPDSQCLVMIYYKDESGERWVSTNSYTAH